MQLSPDRKRDFEKAVSKVRNTQIDDDQLKLRLYALYSLVTKGDPPGKNQAPSRLNFIAFAKFQAWTAAAREHPVQQRENAVFEYIKLAELACDAANADSESKPGSKPPALGRQAPTGFEIGTGAGGGAGHPLDLSHWASVGDLRSVEYMLKQSSGGGGKVDPDARDEDGLTPLMRAADRGHAHVVRALLRAGSASDARDPDGMTPLHYAALCAHPAVVRELVRHGADITAADDDGQTPRDVAADNETRAALEWKPINGRIPVAAAVVAAAVISVAVVVAFVLRTRGTN